MTLYVTNSEFETFLVITNHIWGVLDPESVVNETIVKAMPEQAAAVTQQPTNNVPSGENSGTSESETPDDEEEAVGNSLQDEMKRIELAHLRRHLTVLRVRKQNSRNGNS